MRIRVESKRRLPSLEPITIGLGAGKNSPVDYFSDAACRVPPRTTKRSSEQNLLLFFVRIRVESKRMKVNSWGVTR